MEFGVKEVPSGVQGQNSAGSLGTEVEEFFVKISVYFCSHRVKRNTANCIAWQHDNEA